MTSVSVRVPASSANLGPGFDALGLCLAWYDEVRATIADEDSIEISGEGANSLPRDATNLVLRSIHAACESAEVAVPRVRLECRNTIPHGRGLGSSAAAIVAGVLLGRALAGLPDDRAEALQVATDLEGHPDNVAACLFGGLTIAWSQDGEASAVRRNCVPELRPVVFVPPFALSTEDARRALPQTVPFADAAFNLGRAALLVAALTDRPELLYEATEDRLHQPYRARIMAESTAFLRGLRFAAVPAVISGAGPTILALVHTQAADELAARPPEGWQARAVDVDPAGARLSFTG